MLLSETELPDAKACLSQHVACQLHSYGCSVSSPDAQALESSSLEDDPRRRELIDTFVQNNGVVVGCLGRSSASRCFAIGAVCRLKNTAQLCW